MKKVCAVSGQEFEITDEDLKFYEKMGVPTPTLCPDERMRRRLAFRNMSCLHRRKCDGTGAQIISCYAPENPSPVYDNDFWWGDKWDGREYGRDFDFSRPFFEQFKELQDVVPKMARVQQGENENSQFCNCASYNKNCYLIFAANQNEDVMYGTFVNECRDCMDNFNILKCELAYQCVDCTESYDIQFCQKVHGSNKMRHCWDCRNSANCFACVGLRNQQDFQISNQKVSREEFEEVLKNPEKQKEILKKLPELYLQIPRQYSNFLRSENFSGSYINDCKNVHFCWDVVNLEDCKFCGNFQKAKSCYDIDYYGCTGTNELLYECEGVGHGVFNVKFSKLVWGSSSNLEYCYECFSCQDCFGCIGLQKNQYCILNKQYSKDDYFTLRERIIQYMKKIGEWGEFFPIELSPFAYNETVVNEYFPLIKEEVLKRGWKWKDEDQKNYQPQTYEIPNSIEDVPDSICNEILSCEDCKKNYQIQKLELKFYQKLALPIPRECPDCRHMDRVRLRNPRKLFDRKCDNCSADIQTTYAPDKPEKVFCEKCYLNVVS